MAGLHPGQPSVPQWAGQPERVGGCPQVGLAASQQERNTGVARKEGLGSQRWCWPGVNSLASAGIPSFPDRGISGAKRDSLGLGDAGPKKLKAKNLVPEAGRN